MSLYIRNRISYVNRANIPKTLSQYVALVHQQDETLRSFDPEYFMKLPRKSYLTPASSNIIFLPHDEISSAPSKLELTTGQGEDSIDISCIQLNGLQLISKWIAKDVDGKPNNDIEKARRLVYHSLKNLCLVCGSKDRVSYDCLHSYLNKKRRRMEYLNCTLVVVNGNGKQTNRELETENVWLPVEVAVGSPKLKFRRGYLYIFNRIGVQ